MNEKPESRNIQSTIINKNPHNKKIIIDTRIWIEGIDRRKIDLHAYTRKMRNDKWKWEKSGG